MEELLKLLSDPEQVSVVIYNIASYIVYIYPGIIAIYVYNFLNAKTTHTTQAFVLKSFAISYLFNMIVAKLCEIFKFGINGIRYNVLLIVISFAIPYLLYRFKKSKLFAKICAFFDVATSVTDVPFELLENSGEKFTCLKIYLKDTPCCYIGYICEYEYESEKDKYVILSGYKKYFIDEKFEEKIIKDNKAEQYDEKVYIKLDDIKLIEKISESRAKEEIYIQNSK